MRGCAGLQAGCGLSFQMDLDWPAVNAGSLAKFVQTARRASKASGSANGQPRAPANFGDGPWFEV
jgi:hypothetical protein